MNKEEVELDLLADYKAAVDAKSYIDGKISEWIKHYNGEPYGNERAKRSSIVVRDIYKTHQSMKPNLTEPFIGSQRIVDTNPFTAAGEHASDVIDRAINFFYVNKINRRKIIGGIGDILPKEGTVWVRSGWNVEEKVDKIKLVVPNDMVKLIPDEYKVLESDDVQSTVEIMKTEVVENHPTMALCRNENVFPDPTATSEEEMQFICYEYETTLSELRSDGKKYKNLDKLEAKLNKSEADTALGSMRMEERLEHGGDDSYEFKDASRKKITIVEYWGVYDLNGDGIAEPIMAMWEKKSEIFIRLGDNPLPHGIIPFHSTQFIEVPFSIWGDALTEAMADGQQIHTAIMRGFIDNMAQSNNAQKFIQQGMISPEELRRADDGERYIFLNGNPKEAMIDGSYNPIPQSTFNIYEMVEQMNEGVTGISRINQGLDSGAMSQTATGVSTLTSMSQRRMLDTVRNISFLLKKVFKDWIYYSQEFLSDEEWKIIAGSDGAPKLEYGKDYEVNINVITDAIKQSKIGQYNLMLQNLQYVGGGISAQASRMIIAKFFELFDEYQIADAIKTAPEPKPDPMAQLEAQKVQAEIKKITAEAAQKMADAQAKGADVEKIREQMQLDIQKAMNGMQIDRMKAENDMRLKKEKTRNDIILQGWKAKAQNKEQNER